MADNAYTPKYCAEQISALSLNNALTQTQYLEEIQHIVIQGMAWASSNPVEYMAEAVKEINKAVIQTSESVFNLKD